MVLHGPYGSLRSEVEFSEHFPATVQYSSTIAAVKLTVNISRDVGASPMLCTTTVTLNVFVMEMACVVLVGEPLLMSPV